MPNPLSPKIQKDNIINRNAANNLPSSFSTPALPLDAKQQALYVGPGL